MHHFYRNHPIQNENAPFPVDWFSSFNRGLRDSCSLLCARAITQAIVLKPVRPLEQWPRQIFISLFPVSTRLAFRRYCE